MSIIPIQFLSSSDLSILGTNVMPTASRKHRRKGRRHERNRKTHFRQTKTRNVNQQEDHHEESEE
jgi:hypothetical protein